MTLSHRRISVILVALALAPATALAQPALAAPTRSPVALSATARSQIAAVAADKRSWTPAQQKLDSHLVYAARMMRGEPAVAGIPMLPRVLDHIRMDRQQTVTLDIKAHVDAELLAALRRLGAQIISAFPAYDAVRAQLPLAAVEAAAAIPQVRFIGPAQVPITVQEPGIAPRATLRASITEAVAQTEGNHAHGADLVQALGIAGAGVKVGVLSSGVDSLATEQAAGALPAVTVLSGQQGFGDEGTAMLEIVHTLAPAAQLYFATANGGDAQMATNITALQAAGCNVIVDDEEYLDEGVFQDGPIAQAVAGVTAAGALYFSAAANNGNEDSGTSGTWEGDFLASSTVNSYGTYNDFGNGDASDLLTADARYIVSLKWSDPLGLSTNDYDLYIFNSADQLVDLSTTVQNGTSDPFESVGSQNAGSYVVATLYSGSRRALHLDTEGGQLYYATSSATYGHNAQASAVTVAATNVANAQGNEFLGGAQDPVETYSSDGFRRIFYQANGAAITPGNFLISTHGGTVLTKPDLTAADCVSNNVSGYSPFCGTSAAAPHAGAIAALALSMPNHPTAAAIKAAMLSSALDVMATGVDRDSGSGVVMADRLVAALMPPPAATSFYTVSPCRLVDTRNANGPVGGPALQPGATRTFPLTGACGIPAGAAALSVNLTVTQAAAGGDLRVYPADLTSPPLVSAINFATGQTLASNAVVRLGAGTGSLDVLLDAAGTTQFVLDVNGYYQ
jgi:hypothetical protein